MDQFPEHIEKTNVDLLTSRSLARRIIIKIHFSGFELPMIALQNS